MKEDIKTHINHKKDLQQLLNNKEDQGQKNQQMKQNQNKIKEQMDKYQDKIKNMKEEIRGHIGDNEDLQELISKKQQDNQEQIKQKDNQIEELVENIKQNKNEIRRLNTSNTDLEGVVRMLKEQLDNKDTQINQMQKDMKDQLNHKNSEISRINGSKVNLETNIKKLQQEMNQLKSEVKQHNSNINSIQQLKQSQNKVNIKYHTELDKYKKQIEEFQQHSKQYQIILDLSGCDFYTIDCKMNALRMIETLNANSNVGVVKIILYSDSKWNSEILTMILDRYTNVYFIYFIDYNNYIDHQVHSWIKQYVQQQPIMIFELYFYGPLKHSNDGCELMKQYNTIKSSNTNSIWNAQDMINMIELVDIRVLVKNIQQNNQQIQWTNHDHLYLLSIVSIILQTLCKLQNMFINYIVNIARFILINSQSNQMELI